MTTRLDYCKKELDKGSLEEKNIDSLLQELMNLVDTYKDKKALKDYATELKKK